MPNITTDTESNDKRYRITKTHRAALRHLISNFDSKELRDLYKAKGLSGKRYRWDLIWRADRQQWYSLMDELYLYANDNHIDSVLRGIIGEDWEGTTEQIYLGVQHLSGSIETNDTVDFSFPLIADAIENLSKETYCVTRFYSDERQEIIKTGLTLEEAQEHCKKDDTKGDGWFDGYGLERNG